VNTRIREYEVHPAALVFDELEGKEFDELVASIRERGVLEPIVLYDGKLVDGRNRLRACVVAGIPSDQINKIHLPSEQDPYQFAWEMNGNRRHMTPIRRAEKMLEVQKASGNWQRATEAAREEANRKRAEKMKGIPTLRRASHGNHRRKKVRVHLSPHLLSQSRIATPPAERPPRPSPHKLGSRSPRRSGR
jgi:ParB-like chromosome segregation protein Spo0J